MVKVIKHGNSPLTVECDQCHAILSYWPSDTGKSVTGDYHQEEIVTQEYIECPDCGWRIILKESVEPLR